LLTTTAGNRRPKVPLYRNPPFLHNAKDHA
jgi:hypothetical protein